MSRVCIRLAIIRRRRGMSRTLPPREVPLRRHLRLRDTLLRGNLCRALGEMFRKCVFRARWAWSCGLGWVGLIMKCHMMGYTNFMKDMG